MPALLTAVLGIAFSLYAFNAWRGYEVATAENQARAAATVHLNDLRRSIAKPFDSIAFVETLIEATGPVDRAAFARFARHVLSHNPEIGQLIWAPVVPGPTADERAGRLPSPPGFTAAYIFPIANSPAGSELAGRDIASLPDYAACLATVSTFVEPADRLCVIPLADGFDILAILMAERTRSRPDDPPLWGIVAGRIHLVVPIGPKAPFKIEIFNRGAGGTTDLLHPAIHAESNTDAILAGGGVLADLGLGSDIWRLVCVPERPGPEWPSRESLLLLGGCLAITANPTGYLLLILRGRRRIEGQVDERTRELKTALGELRLGEQRLRDYAATASDWYWETGPDLRFTLIAAEARDHKIEPDDLIGLDRLTADDAENEVAQRRELLGNHEMFRDLRYDYGTDRDLLTLSLSGLPIVDATGTFLGYRGSARDITLQLQVEARQRQARWIAEQANRAKSIFLATMSHEIRTPINGVVGMAQVLSDTALDPEQRRMCDVIYRSGNSLQQILNDILDYSKLEAGKIALESIASSLIEIVDSVVDLMRGTAEASGLVIEVETGDNPPPEVVIDPTRFRQVLFNLVSNAIKFSERGVVRIGLRGVNAGPDDVAITLEVADQGIGISEEAQERLFSRFSQADGTTTRRYGGTGLGLAITRELVTLMGGTIDVSSVVGQGSTFIVRMTLPVAAPVTRALAPPRPDEQAADARVLDILVAEDNDTNQEVIRGLLRGHRLTMAGDGAQAVEAAAANGFDIVLMDVMMPVMNGIEATVAIRALPPPRSTVPIVALTANAMSGDRERYLAAGMNGYISKPIDRRSLLDAIETAVGGPVMRPMPAHSATAPPPAVTAEAVLEIDDFLATLDV